jgi:hypothetical protein
MRTSVDIHMPSDSVATSVRYDALTPEQFSCFLSMRSDVRAVASSQRSTFGDVQAIFTALRTGTPADWEAVVHAVDRLLQAVPAGSARSARARLEQFIAENAELLQT